MSSFFLKFLFVQKTLHKKHFPVKVPLVLYFLIAWYNQLKTKLWEICFISSL